MVVSVNGFLVIRNEIDVILLSVVVIEIGIMFLFLVIFGVLSLILLDGLVVLL